MLLIQKTPKIAATVDDPFNPDHVADDAKQNRMATDERHARTFADFRPELVEQGSLSHHTEPRPYLSYEGDRPRRTVLRDV
jgi:hypothetical protein